MTSAPSERASRAVSRPMPALPPSRTTVCPISAGSRWPRDALTAVLMVPPDLASQVLQRGDVNLRERWEWLDRVAQHRERNPGADRERGLLEPLARLGTERVGAGQPLA